MSGARVAALVVRNALGTALWLILALLARLIRSAGDFPDHFIQGVMDLTADLATTTTWRGRLLGLLILPILATAPAWAGPATISVMISALWFAYVGQAWNLLMGFAGRLSLGHCLFVGLGAYLGVDLFIQNGLSPWFGLVAAVAVAALAGAGIGALGCRAGLSGVHFALITLVFVELGRMGAGHLEGLGGVEGLILPPPLKPGLNLLALHGGPAMFYYIILGMTLLTLLLCRLLTRSRLGYRWRAVRDDPMAAAATGINVYRTRISALTISAALIAPAGVFQAFYAGGLSPDQLFSLSRSVDILLGAAVGGIGTLLGPIVGAFVVSPIGDALTELTSHGSHDLSSLRPFCSGVVLMAVAALLPGGLWPWLARRLKLTPPPEEPEAPRLQKPNQETAP